METAVIREARIFFTTLRKRDEFVSLAIDDIFHNIVRRGQRQSGDDKGLYYIHVNYNMDYSRMSCILKTLCAKIVVTETRKVEIDLK